FVRGDIADAEVVTPLVEKADYVVNFAAETHVDRSIEDQSKLIRANIEGPLTLLNAARKHPVKRFIQVGTDEVYGEVMGDPVTEEAPLHPRNPYSAAKVGGDAMAMAYHATFGLPVVVTRCSNNYGPYQYPEKMIPLFTTNAMVDKSLPVYGSGKNQRDWIHVADHCRALDAILAADADQVDGEIFNIGAGNEKDVLQIADIILSTLDKPKSLLEHVTDRLGHDRRYALSPAKIKERLGFVPEIEFEDGLPQTIHWYVENKDWWERIKSGEFLKYYDQMYGKR
ncbi:MAG: NAD-dependent epimerase/dehydratase family protein, partial [Candidatus Eisenbacteria bacterium]|nr:NAD-dependent epimerase/dehydratase family protein [Candidatus Eisenbacteria bacterium]